MIKLIDLLNEIKPIGNNGFIKVSAYDNPFGYRSSYIKSPYTDTPQFIFDPADDFPDIGETVIVDGFFYIAVVSLDDDDASIINNSLLPAIKKILISKHIPYDILDLNEADNKIFQNTAEIYCVIRIPKRNIKIVKDFKDNG